ncbi:PIN domain-containing protein [Egibacter rhizosphaerae]|uniref:Ribonuclease VapC n=1 Tax=Egibacter rhizosphaerae TaxID=1670831 RepID=A0A411YHP2_9ACTN|nr:type II toxin-antitoxin system VapC family toxin [Egibacter rhizosphaerae]QBI20760.1 PIN domain-containing protein [Egibacter rhizosphaerae]
MTLYVDTSALLKLYVEEAESVACEALLDAEPDVVTARHTAVEARRALTVLLDGGELAAAREQFAQDWTQLRVVEVDAALCETAAAIAERTWVRTLDALHIAAAAGAQTPVVSYDGRLAKAAEAESLEVIAPGIQQG